MFKLVKLHRFEYSNDENISLTTQSARLTLPCLELSENIRTDLKHISHNSSNV